MAIVMHCMSDTTIPLSYMCHPCVRLFLTNGGSRPLRTRRGCSWFDAKRTVRTVLHEACRVAVDKNAHPNDEWLLCQAGPRGAQRAEHRCRGHAVGEENLRRRVAQDEAQLPVCPNSLVSTDLAVTRRRRLLRNMLRVQGASAHESRRITFAAHSLGCFLIVVPQTLHTHRRTGHRLSVHAA